MLGNRQDAEEAVQDIFLKAHRGLANFRGKSEIRTWLYKITVNTCLTRLRTRAPEHLHPDAYDLESGYCWDNIGNEVDDPAELLIEKDAADLVVRALEHISAEHKEIMLLFHVDELGYEEIARVLDLPISTVAARLHKARRRLRCVMGAIQKELKG